MFHRQKVMRKTDLRVGVPLSVALVMLVSHIAAVPPIKSSKRHVWNFEGNECFVLKSFRIGPIIFFSIKILVFSAMLDQPMTLKN